MCRKPKGPKHGLFVVVRCFSNRGRGDIRDIEGEQSSALAKRMRPANCGRFASIEGNDSSARVQVAMLQFSTARPQNLSFAPILYCWSSCPRALQSRPTPNPVASIRLLKHSSRTQRQISVLPYPGFPFHKHPSTEGGVIHEQEGPDHRR